MFEIIKIKIYVVYIYIQRIHTVTFMLYCWESNGEGCSLSKTGRGLMSLNLTGDPGRDVLRTVPGDWYPIAICRCCQPAQKNSVAKRSVRSFRSQGENFTRLFTVRVSNAGPPGRSFSRLLRSSRAYCLRNSRSSVDREETVH